MHILLINNNPVVSRLLTLCTRDKHMVLEEIESIEMIEQEKYDVVFIDEGSYAGDVLNLSSMVEVGTKVLLSNADVEINDFDMTVKKPFLPSQIIEILDSANNNQVDVQEEESLIEDLVEEPTIFPLTEDTLELEDVATEEPVEYKSSEEVLDSSEIEKIKSLLDMEDEVPEEELSDETYEERKIAAIKEQLIAEGLEIVGEEEIVEELSIKSDDESLMTVFSSEDDDTTTDKKVKDKKKSSRNEKKNKKSKKKKKKKKKDLAFNEENLERIEDAVQVAIATLKRKQMKKLLKGKKIEVTIKLEGND